MRNLSRPLRSLVLAVTVLTLPLTMGGTGTALSFNSARDCDDNAVIRCGSLSTSELVNDVDGSSYAQNVYKFFGISKSAVDNMPTTAIKGQVTDKNTVLVNGKVIATDAITAGRQNITNSNGGSKQVGTGTNAFFVRSPSVSFKSSPLDAFVVLGKSNQFMFAILSSCDNPVIATPVPPKPAPKPTPTPKPKPTPTPTPVAPTTPAAAPPTQLTNTGPGPVLAIFAGTTVIATAGSYYLQKRRSVN